MPVTGYMAPSAHALLPHATYSMHRGAQYRGACLDSSTGFPGLGAYLTPRQVKPGTPRLGASPRQVKPGMPGLVPNSHPDEGSLRMPRLVPNSHPDELGKPVG